MTTITALQLAQAEMPTSAAALYTVPASTIAYVKDINICNTTAGVIVVSLWLVPASGSRATANAFMANVQVPANGTVEWQGTQILPAGATIQALAAASGVGITISGAQEA